MNSFISNKKNRKNQIKIKENLRKIKSDFFLRILFNHLEKKKILHMVKYNKQMQNILNINLNDYKEIHDQIEIEVIPVKNNYGKFINFQKEDEIFYHIYFNNHTQEVKRNYFTKKDKVSKIRIIIDYQVDSLFNLFYQCYCIESINFKKFYRNNIFNMGDIFHECTSLKEINLSNFNTENVEDMGGMFWDCILLEELNISNFNTSNVTDINSMFWECSSLKKLNLSNFNTSNVTDMEVMFYRCSSLNELNLSNFNTDKVKSMKAMFQSCSSLKKLNISSFNFNNVIYIEGFLYNCPEELIKKIKTQYKNIKDDSFKEFKFYS